MKTAVIGFRAKTGKAIAIALAGKQKTPEFLGRWNVSLHDPEIPATYQPHHEVMELPWAEAQRAVRVLERSIEKITIAVLKELARELKGQGFDLACVAAVGSPDRNLEKIGNFHIRAHAAEGILFRRVIETAAEKRRLNWRSFSDRDILHKAAEALDLPEEKVTDTLTSIGKIAGRPWRQDERIAALAAWLALPK
ncbi:MAG TPA: hypothetical protein VGO50_11515 [Pyrinomonadaceae bacterium]|jgi:hypothetical protein|nr:hypothetical protein [Pyrinomonadaceae bacterium]